MKVKLADFGLARKLQEGRDYANFYGGTFQDCCICFGNEIDRLKRMNIWIEAIGFHNADLATLDILVRGGGHQSMAQTMEEVHNIFVQLAEKAPTAQIPHHETNLIYPQDSNNNFPSQIKQPQQNFQSPLRINKPNFNVIWNKKDFQCLRQIGSGGFGTICLVKEKLS
ncbi:MAG: hypothetical protein EZS28_039513, partial [Streblomastix strix]